MQSQVTIKTLYKMKEKGEKIVALTAYDFPFARMVDESGVHLILVGDSLGMVVQGESSTLPVTMDEMVYHTRMVSRAARRAMVVGDMPFMSYQVGVEDAVRNAGRFLQESGMNAVKLEGGRERLDAVRAILDAGIPVLAHLGLTPQSIHKFGGFKGMSGRDFEDFKEIGQSHFVFALKKIQASLTPDILAKYEEISEQLSKQKIRAASGRDPGFFS